MESSLLLQLKFLPRRPPRSFSKTDDGLYNAGESSGFGLQAMGLCYSTCFAFTSITGPVSCEAGCCFLRSATTSTTHPVQVGNISVTGRNSRAKVGSKQRMKPENAPHHDHRGDIEQFIGECPAQRTQ
jgi:hypothetical protein